MEERKFKIARALIALIFTTSLFGSCATTKKTVAYNIPASLESDYMIYPNDENFTFSSTDSYIFFRLYNPKYVKTTSGAILQAGLNIVDSNDFKGSHIAIGFDLTDNFYGLTLYAAPNFKIEQCTNTTTNEYMVGCDSENSLQTTFALNVSKEEYFAAKKMIEEYVSSEKLRYDTGRNFPIASDTIHRAFSFTHKTKRTYKRALKEQKMREMLSIPTDDTKFVCSTVVAHVLDETIPEIHEYFVNNNLDYNFITPSDITSISGVHPLFTSTWASYKKAAMIFSREHPEFAHYLVNDSTLHAKAF